MKKGNKYVDENLIYVFKNSTPYQRMVWLKKAFEFWKLFQVERLEKIGYTKSYGGFKR